MKYAFANLVLDIDRGELLREGDPVAVEPRVFGLLTHMLAHRGRLVERDDLISSVWDGRIVSDAAISTAVKAARRAIGDDGGAPLWLKTVRGRGFRFDGEVTVTGEAAQVVPDQDASPDGVSGPDLALAQPKTPSVAIFDKPSVLVMGFDCAGGNGTDSALALGIAQEVRLNLSHWRWFPVLGPESVGYKTASELDIRTVSKEMGAAFTLSGSVRSIGGKVRVNATLTSTENGSSIWSRHFDGTLENLFDFEEEVSCAIVAQIEPELFRANSQRLMQSRPSDLSAWQMLLAAGESQRLGGEGYGTQAANDEQKGLIKAALENDPGMSRAWAWLAKCHWRDMIMGWSAAREESLQATLDTSQTAMELNPANWEARSYRALALLFGRHEFVESEFHAREAVRLNPSDASARHVLGCVLENIGKTDEALEHLRAVFRLNPNHPNSAGVLGDIATCQMLSGQTPQVEETVAQLIAIAPHYSRGLQRAIAALAHAGRMERAREVVALLREVQPDFSEDYVRTTYPFQRAADMEMFVDGLKIAGAFDGE